MDADYPNTGVNFACRSTREGYEARPHGFCATFRTWAEECTDAPFEVKEACLGHVVDRGVVGAYQRGERLNSKFELLRVWAGHLLF